MEGNNYITLDRLEVYLLSRSYSKISWNIYEKLSWQDKKVIGDQMITSVDSVGANIAEGYGRFHYADKNKFYYNSRGSLLESKHWIELLFERSKLPSGTYKELVLLFEQIFIKLNILIKSQLYQKSNGR